MAYVTGRHGRRKSNPFDICAQRRREIVRHARLVGAADTEDFSRWLIAWVWHSPRAADQIWSLMNAARTMGREITEAEASAITEKASITRKHLSADNLARWLGVTYDQRQTLGLTTIGSTNVGKRARKELRKRRWRLNAERRRRGRGMRPQSQSLSRLKPWAAEGISRRTWERRRHRNMTRTQNDANWSTPIFLISEDGLASARTAAEAGASHREASKELSSSQTGTIAAADPYESFPVELRLLALGLPLPDAMRKAASRDII
jgi:hypothetical protein